MLPISRSAMIVLVAGSAVCTLGSQELRAQYSKSISTTLNQQFGIELDSADQRRSEWFKTDLKSLSALRANCTVLRVGSSDATFGFEAYFTETGEQTSSKGARLWLSTDPDKSSIAMNVRSWNAAEKKYVTVKQFNKKIHVDEEFLVEMIWAGKKLRIAVSDTESYQLILPQPIDEIYISANTGNMRCNAALGTGRF
jgi:hypothetical protein